MAFASLKNTIYSWFTKEPLGVEHGGTGSNSVDVVSKIEELESAWDSVSQDYVVEQGTSGIWTYRKWASGVAECWTTKVSVTLTAVDTQIREWYSFPITFLENPSTIPSPCNTGKPTWLLEGGFFGVESLSTTGFHMCACANVGANYLPLTFNFAVEVIGRWK